MLASYYRTLLLLLLFSLFIVPVETSLLHRYGNTIHIDISALQTKDSTFISTINGLSAKLPLAQSAEQHKIIGFDIVAHSINELIAQGASPLFFTSYFAASVVLGNPTSLVIEGIASACLQSQCTFFSSQIVEMQKLFKNNDYDIGGMAIGIRNGTFLSHAEGIRPSDVIIGLTTTGLHGTSFTAIQSLIDRYTMDIRSKAPFVTPHSTLADALLAPLTLYHPSLIPLLTQIPLKAIASVGEGGLYDTLVRLLPGDLAASLDLQRWPLPPLVRWIKQIGNYTPLSMAQLCNLGIGMVIITDRHHAPPLLTLLQQENSAAFSIGTIQSRSHESRPISLKGTIGSNYSRVLVIGNGTQEHMLAWKLAQSPWVERVFVIPGNGGTNNEPKVHNLFINPTHHSALIAYARQNSIDMVIVENSSLCLAGLVDEFRNAGIVCIGPTKKAAHLLTQPEMYHFMEQHKIPRAKPRLRGTPVCFTVIWDSMTVLAGTSCHQYKEVHSQASEPYSKNSGACSPAPSITPTLQERIMHEIINPLTKGLLAAKAPFCGFLTVDLIITDEGEPLVVAIHPDLGTCEAAALLMRLQTELATICYAAYHHQLSLLTLTWHPHPSLSFILTHATADKDEVIVGLPDGTPASAKVFHMETQALHGTYSTHGHYPLCIVGQGETLEKARNNAYKLAQPIYWPGMDYRKDIGYWEITRQ